MDALQNQEYIYRDAVQSKVLLSDEYVSFQVVTTIGHHNRSGLFLADGINNLYMSRYNLTQFSKSRRGPDGFYMFPSLFL